MHNLTTKLLRGIEQLKQQPDAPVVVGVYREVFEIFISKTVGSISLSSTENLDRIKRQLTTLPSVSSQLDHLNQVFNVNKNQCDFGIHELRLDHNKGVQQQDLEKKAADQLAKSVTHATINVNLPQSHTGNPKIIERSSAQIYSRENILDIPDVKTELTTVINNVITDSQAPPLPKQIVDDLASKATNAIKEPPKRVKISAVATLLTSALFISQLAQKPTNADDKNTDSTHTESSMEGDTITASTLLGGYLLAKKVKESFSEPTTGIPSQGLNVGSILTKFLSSTLRTITNIISNLIPAGRIANLLRGVSRILNIGGLFSGLFGQRQATNIQDSTKKTDLLIAGLLLFVLLLIIGPNYHTNTVKKAAIVSNVHNISPSPKPKSEACVLPSESGGDNQPENTCVVETSVTPIPPLSPQPVSGKIPQGFPVSSSCVTQPPGGIYSHKTLNGVDIGAISQNVAWVIKSTHAGTVIVAGNFGGYGLAVLIESDDRLYITYYGHMRRGSIKVSAGEHVETAAPLGIVDSTGFSSGDHVHYELRGPRGVNEPWGSKSGPFGAVGTILNFLPNCRTWSCQWYCK